MRRLDDGHRTMVLLDDHLDALPDLLQNAGEIAGEFCFGDADSRHLFDHSVCHGSPGHAIFTKYRATLFSVEQRQNITLSLPRELLRQVKRLAADRDTSVSAMMIEALKRLADEDRRYSAARKRALAALRSTRSLGTGGNRTWSRDQLHER